MALARWLISAHPIPGTETQPNETTLTFETAVLARSVAVGLPLHCLLKIKEGEALSREEEERLTFLRNHLSHIRDSYHRHGIIAGLYEGWRRLFATLDLPLEVVQGCHLLLSTANELIQSGEDTGRFFSAWQERYNEHLRSAEGQSERVMITTVHGAKGLEFDHVFLPAMQSGASKNDLPFWTSGRFADWKASKPKVDRPKDAPTRVSEFIQAHDKILAESEVIRLFYVAVTRTKSHLYLSTLDEVFQEKDGEYSPSKRGGGFLLTSWRHPLWRTRWEKAIEARKAAIQAHDATQKSFVEDEVDEFAPRKTFTRRPKSALDTPSFKATAPLFSANIHLESLTKREKGTIWHGVYGAILTLSPDSALEESPLYQDAKHHALSGGVLDETQWAVELSHILATYQNDSLGRALNDAHQSGRLLLEYDLIYGDKSLRADAILLPSPPPNEMPLTIIDFKFSSVLEGELEKDFLARERGYYKEQLETYADAVREEFGYTQAIHLALHFPILGWFVRWKSGEDVRDEGTRS